MNLFCEVTHDGVIERIYTSNFKTFYDNNLSLYDRNIITKIFKRLGHNLINNLQYEVNYTNRVGWCLCEPKCIDIIDLISGPGYNYIPIGHMFNAKIIEIEYILNDWAKMYNRDKYINISQLKLYCQDNYFFKGPYECVSIISIDKYVYKLYSYGLSKEESISNLKTNINKLICDIL